MNKHACILWCFNNTDHIRQCFESIELPFIDFFIVENISPHSNEIEMFFASKKLTGYIQFKENIGDNAVKIFLKDYADILKKYEYITFSDCDLKTSSGEALFTEIYNILEHDEVGVCTADLRMDNFPHSIAKPIDWLPLPTKVTDDYVECATGSHFLTVKNKNLDILLISPKAIDNQFRMECFWKKLKWVKTKKNKVKHLTWDYYHEGNEYYKFRKEHPNIFNQTKTSTYRIIV